MRKWAAAKAAWAEWRRMDANEAIAREEIRDTISRYNHAGDRGHLDALVALLHRDGVLDLEDETDCERPHRDPARGSRGGRTIGAVAARALCAITSRASGSSSPGSSTAIAASYFLVFTEIGLDHWGRYADRFARADGAWRIAHRKVRVDGATPSSRMASAHRVGGGGGREGEGAALVTGARRGLGRAIALELARRGFSGARGRARSARRRGARRRGAQRGSAARGAAPRRHASPRRSRSRPGCASS
jgi:hypothetical protein